jgi:cyclopropane fatty-acyl-phospholipid synthase-like methyltransferase
MDKIRKQPVDWLDIYKNAPTNIWEPKPHHFSTLAASLAPNGNATDLGSGEGYDAHYFAERGFATTAVDISEVALESLKAKVSRDNIDIQTQVGDVKTIELTRPQAIIASYGVLHFLGVKFEDRIKHFQDMTVANGVHAMYTFGDKGDFYDIGKHKYWFPSIDELRMTYANWNIRRLEEKTVEMLVRGDNNEMLHNKLIKILAQKGPTDY